MIIRTTNNHLVVVFFLAVVTPGFVVNGFSSGVVIRPPRTPPVTPGIQQWTKSPCRRHYYSPTLSPAPLPPARRLTSSGCGCSSLQLLLYSANPRHHNQEIPPLPSQDSSSSLIKSSINGDDNPQPQQVEGKRGKRRKLLTAAIAVGAAAAAAAALFFSGTTLSSLLPSPASINEWLRTSLNKLNESGWRGLTTYAVLFTLWTMTIGITTPVETAAGFAFGIRRAILVNALAKTLGALVAFGLGRFILYDTVHARAKQNETLQLVEESIGEHPLLVALMVRLSPLPEPIKNMGISVLDIRSRFYVASLLLHGFPFTCLWSCMGAETAKIVTLGVQPSTTLKVLVSGSTWFGVIVSPSLIGWWLNSLRAKRSKRLLLSQQQQQQQSQQ